MEGKTVNKILEYLALLLILAIAVYARFTYKGAEFGEFGEKYSFESLRIAEGHSFPLIGSGMSGGGAHGPLALYIGAIPLLVSKHPLSSYIFTTLLTILAVFLCYKFGKEFFNEKVGLIAALLFALSSSSIQVPSGVVSRERLIPLFVILLFYSVYSLAIKNKPKYIILVLVFLACSLQMHIYTALLVFPLAGVLILAKPKINLKYLAIGVVLFILLFSPLIYFELTHNFWASKGIFSNVFNRYDQWEWVDSGSFHYVFDYNHKILTEFNTKCLYPKIIILLVFSVSLAYLIYIAIPKSKKNIRGSVKCIGLLSWFIIPNLILLASPKNYAPYYYYMLIPVHYLIMAVFLSAIMAYLAKITFPKVKWSIHSLFVLVAILAVVSQLNFTEELRYSPVPDLDKQMNITKAFVYNFNITQEEFMNNLHGNNFNTPCDGARYFFYYVADKKGSLSNTRKIYDRYTFTGHTGYLYNPFLNRNFSEKLNKEGYHYLILNEEEYSPSIIDLETKKVDNLYILKYNPLINYTSLKYSFTELPGWTFTELPGWNKLSFDDSGWNSNISFDEWRNPLSGYTQKRAEVVYVRGHISVLSVTHIRNLTLVIVTLFVGTSPKNPLLVYLNENKILPYYERKHCQYLERKYDISGYVKKGDNLIALKLVNHRNDCLDIYEIGEK